MYEIRDRAFKDWMDSEEVTITIKHDFLNSFNNNGTDWMDLSSILQLAFNAGWSGHKQAVHSLASRLKRG